MVLMDIGCRHGRAGGNQPILDAIRIRRPRILVVTTFDEDEHVFEALRSGASGSV